MFHRLKIVVPTVALGLGLCALVAGSNAPVEDAKWVTVKGQVILEKPVAPSEIDVKVDAAHCLAKGKLFTESILVNKESKGLKNVVVWLRPDDDDRKAVLPAEKINPGLAKPAAKHHIIDQPCCQFVPRILAVRAGDTLEVKNSSPVPHNINYKGENSFNVTIPPQMSHKMAGSFTPTSVPVPFECNIHPWMNGRIRVFEHPYYTITDENGKYEIKDIPAGKWRLVYWHEEGFHKGRAGITGEPFVTTGATTELKPISFEFPK